MRNITTTMETIAMLTILLFCALPADSYAQGTVVFWNKMGSISELKKSEIGPGFDYTHGLKEFGPVTHGNGVEYDYNIGGAGAHLLSYTQMGPMSAGTIEYWYLSNTEKIDRETAYLPGIRDPLGNGIGVSLNWDSCYGERCGLSMNVTTAPGKHSRIQTGTYGDANITFSTTEATHLAFVWDSNGIDGTTDTMRVYRNNQILLSDQSDLSDWDNTQTAYRVHGGGDWRSSWRTAPNGKIDNLIIWNFAKTDFSDRFIENPIPDRVCNQNNHCYQRFDDTMSWHTAIAHCENEGGYLATITSKEEQDFVYDKLVSASANNCWLGATDEPEEGNWHWFNEEKWKYDNWSNDQSDNCDGLEHYAVMMNADGSWQDKASLNNGAGSCDCPMVFEPMSTICEWGDILGDLNGDNKVDEEDYKELVKSFGKCKGQSGYNTKADYDDDGCVTIRDYGIWYGYYTD